nr:MAG TPA: hypothetical protein [Caudoviricetes sp.]
MGLKYKNSSGEWVKIPILSEIDDNSTPSNTKTWSSQKIQAEIPTKVSDLNNDSNFITTAVDNLTNYYLKTDTYSKEEVNNLIDAIKSFNIEVVEKLPIVMKEATIYLVPNGQGEEDNYYNEYIYVNNKVELIGNTKVDISGKQDKLTAGANITIENNIISAEVPTKTSQLTNDNNFVSDKSYVHTDNNYTTDEKNKLVGLNNYDDTEIKKSIATKQDELVSGVNIKTYNGESILTTGDIVQPITILTQDFDFDELPLGTRGMYLTTNTLIIQFNGQRYSTNSYYLYFFSYISSNKKTLNLVSVGGMTKRTVEDNILTAIRSSYMNPTDYAENHSRTCYSDVKVDKLLENIRELPAVTTSDNDKILKVVDGVWTAVTLANGDEVSY